MNTQARKAVIIFSLLGWFVPACGAPEPLRERQVLRVGILRYLSFAPLFIAQDEGFFAEQGLDVEFIRMSRSSDAIPALDRGELDVIGGAISPSSLNAAKRRAMIRVVADKGHLDPTACASYALMARRDLVEAGDLKGPAQLRGKRIATQLINVGTYYLETLLYKAGLAPGDVEIVDLPDAAGLDAMENGAVDLWLTGEPWISRLLQAGHSVLWNAMHEVIPNFQAGAILYGPNLLQKNPDAGRRFMIAYLKGVRQYNQGKTERTLDILAKHTGLDRELVRQTCWIPIRQDGRINPQSVLDYQTWAIKKKWLDGPVSADQFWEPSFIEYAGQVVNGQPQ
jgi:NitT/TauT family transport system substrate-binding protein